MFKVISKGNEKKRKFRDRRQICFLILTFHDGGSYDIETSPLICSGFYMIWSCVMKELSEF